MAFIKGSEVTAPNSLKSVRAPRLARPQVDEATVKNPKNAVRGWVLLHACRHPSPAHFELWRHRCSESKIRPLSVPAYAKDDRMTQICPQNLFSRLHLWLWFIVVFMWNTALVHVRQYPTHRAKE